MQPKNYFYLVGSILYLSISYSVFLFLNTQSIRYLAREDGIYESIGAIFFLITSVIFFVSFWKCDTGNDFKFIKTRKNVFYLLLGIVFFIGFGEEISWGQRIFNVETPELFKEINVQNEINLHNLQILQDSPGRNKIIDWIISVDSLFALFLLFYCILIPVFNKLNSNFNRFLKKINLPIVPIFIGIFFIVNYITSRIINSYVPANLRHCTVEIKETNFGFLFLLVSIFLFQNNIYKKAKYKNYEH